MSKDKSTIKKLKDVNLYTIDELKTMLGFLTDKDAYTVDNVRSKIDILKSQYPNLARKGGFLDQAANRILKDINIMRLQIY